MANNDTNIADMEVLLDRVRKIARNHEEQDRASGRKFNVFAVTGMQRNEVSTHSAMIAELLNPYGSHSQQSQYLCLFLSMLAEATDGACPCDLDAKKCRVTTEKSTEYGRIDILLEFGNYRIVIENKIDAADQQDQLDRYRRFAEERPGEYLICYLTLSGMEPSAYALGTFVGAEQRGRLCLLSYREHIHNWIARCSNKAPEAVGQILLQYAALIRKLTGESINMEEAREIEDLLLDHMPSAARIASAFQGARGKLLFSFFEAIETRLGLVSVVKDGIPKDRFYDLEKCRRWFKSDRHRCQAIGVFFDISIPNMLLYVSAATWALHFGVVWIKKEDKQWTILPPGQEISRLMEQTQEPLEKKNWERVKFEWASVVFVDDIYNQISDESLELLNPSTDAFRSLVERIRAFGVVVSDLFGAKAV